MAKQKVLNVLYQSDDNYAMVTGTSMVSLLENNKHLDDIYIYYLDYKITPQNRNNLEEIAARYANCHFNLIDARPYNHMFVELGVKSWRGIYVTWLKLLALGDIKVSTDRIIFINGQTIINSPLDELLDLDFKDNVMALAYDCLLNDHKATLGFTENDKYYNCGIMLINHAKWQKDNLNQKVKESLKQKSDYVIVDQDFCNVIFKNQILLLDSTYNFSSAYYAYNLKGLLKINKLTPEYFYSYNELMANYYCPKIIHSLFGIAGKPWEEGNRHPQKYLWDKYIEMTPWGNAKRPIAKYNINWLLYDILPSSLFLHIYKFGVKSKYGKKRRNRLVVLLFDLFTPQKGT